MDDPFYYAYQGDWRYRLPCYDKLTELGFHFENSTIFELTRLTEDELRDLLRSRFNDGPEFLSPIREELLRFEKIMVVVQHNGIALELSFPGSFTEPKFSWRPTPWLSEPHQFDCDAALNFLTERWREEGTGKEDTGEEALVGDSEALHWELKQLASDDYRELYRDEIGNAKEENLYIVNLYRQEDVEARLRDFNMQFYSGLPELLTLMCGLRFSDINMSGHFLDLEEFEFAEVYLSDHYSEDLEYMKEGWSDGLVIFHGPNGDLLTSKKGQIAWIKMSERRTGEVLRDVESFVPEMIPMMRSKFPFDAYGGA